MKFRYLGTEHDPSTTFMGFDWVKGQIHDVTDPHAIKKLSGSVLFEKVEGDAKDKAPKKPAEKAA